MNLMSQTLRAMFGDKVKVIDSETGEAVAGRECDGRK